MRHRMKRGKLGRTTSHKEAMLSNLLVSLIKSGAVETTESKAKNLKPLFERIISQAIEGTNATTIQVIRWVDDKEAFKTLQRSLVPRLKERKGGYCRIYKTRFRQGDGAPMARVEILSE